MRLTKTAIDKLQLPPGKQELIMFDEDLSGFGLRLRAGGKRTWVVQYRLGKQQRKVTIGTPGTLSPDQARQRARALLAKVHLGQDPQSDKQAARAEAAVTLASVVEAYLEQHAANRLRSSTLTDVQRYLRRHWAPLLRLPVAAVTRAEVAAHLQTIATESGRIAANRARSTLSSMFAWAISMGLVEFNPVVGTRKVAEERARDRVLSDAEVRLIWLNAGDGDYGDILRLLILTAQRREEVAAMAWSELDLSERLWSFQGERSKNGELQIIPLSEPALAILAGRHAVRGRDLVFGQRGPFSGWSKAKLALDDRITAHQGAALAPWRVHDIRRTVATRMADLGVLPHVIEVILNHKSGHKAGIAGVYNRSAYAVEKAAALARWADYLARLVNS